MLECFAVNRVVDVMNKLHGILNGRVTPTTNALLLFFESLLAVGRMNA